MKPILALLLLFSTLLIQQLSAKEKLFVVERESESLAIIENGLVKRHMKNMHNMNHGVMAM